MQHLDLTDALLMIGQRIAETGLTDFFQGCEPEDYGSDEIFLTNPALGLALILSRVEPHRVSGIQITMKSKPDTGRGNGAFSAVFRGRLPFGISRHADRKDIERLFGSPDVCRQATESPLIGSVEAGYVYFHGADRQIAFDFDADGDVSLIHVSRQVS
ncbi:hypothetical protein CHH27_23595 [Labrenzia sp. VG12]|nr:hypothetical protein CHH27_23595 [Labrenzia sp. VG12]